MIRLPKKRLRMFMGIVVIGVVMWAVALRSLSPGLDDARVWTRIKTFRGVLSPVDGEVEAFVDQALIESNTWERTPLMQNRVEVRKDKVSYRFMWPDASYAARICKVLDLDGDGAREFLFGGGNSVRVVTFSMGSFRFREIQDQLFSIGYDVDPTDLDGDGRMEFIKGDPFPSDFSAQPAGLTISFPRVFRWSAETGFVDSSNEYPRFYHESVLPKFEEELGRTHETERKKVLHDAIRLIRNSKVD